MITLLKTDIFLSKTFIYCYFNISSFPNEIWKFLFVLVCSGSQAFEENESGKCPFFYVSILSLEVVSSFNLLGISMSFGPNDQHGISGSTLWTIVLKHQQTVGKDAPALSRGESKSDICAFVYVKSHKVLVSDFSEPIRAVWVNFSHFDLFP